MKSSQTGLDASSAPRRADLVCEAIILGLIQGVAELFPISSLGQSVVLPHLFGWNIHQNDPYFLSFLVATHLATALVLLGFFWRDWVRIVRGLVRSLRERAIAEDNPDGRLGWLLIIGHVPAGSWGWRSGFAPPRVRLGLGRRRSS